MSYVNDSLISGERVIHTAKVSIWSLTPLILLGILLLGFFGLGLVLFVVAYLRYISTELAFTNKRVIAKFGFISRKTIEMNIGKVESIQVNQGILGRIFDYGSLVVSGAGNPQAPIPGIAAPMAFRKAYMEHADSANAGRNDSPLASRNDKLYMKLED